MANLGAKKFTRSHGYRWEDGDGYLTVGGESKSGGGGGKHSPRPPVIRLCFHLDDVREVVDLPPQDRPQIHALAVGGGSWVASTSLESTRAWASILAVLDAATRLPTDARAYFKVMIICEIQSAAQRAERIRHDDVRLRFVLNVRTRISYQDYLDFTVQMENERSEQEEEGASFEAIYESVLIGELRSTDSELRTCSVCLDEIDMESNVGQMPCGHMFHSKCIVRWLRSKNSCPVCRSELPEVK